MRHLANAQYWDRPAGGNTGRLFLALVGQSAPTGLAIVHWIGSINAIKIYIPLCISLYTGHILCCG